MAVAGNHYPPPDSRGITSLLGIPFGQATAIDGVGLGAAPPLAGFTFALIVLILQDQEALRWPNLSLAILTASAVLLIAAVQSAFTARRYYVPPDVWVAWLELGAREGYSREDELQKKQMNYLVLSRRWRQITRHTYNLGIALLFAGVTSSLVPRGEILAFRWVAIIIALAGLIAEVTWSVTLVRSDRGEARGRRDAGRS